MRIGDWSSDVCASDLLAGPFLSRRLRRCCSMAIKDILLHYGASDRSAARANLAMALAKRHGAHLTAVYTVPGWPLFERVAAASGGERLSKYDLRLEEQASQAKADFSNHAAELGIMGEWRTMKGRPARSEEHTSELQSLMRISYAVFCLKKKR